MSSPAKFINRRSFKNRNESLESDRGLERCRSIDLNEIFQFSASRQRALERNAEIRFEQPLKNFVRNRVFINHVDSFNGKILADYLSGQQIDIFKSESVVDEEEKFSQSEEDLEDDSKGNHRNENEKTKETFEIYGTADFIKNPNYLRPESVTEILDEEMKDDFLAKILSCGFIIYDISSALSCHPLQIEEAKWILNNIINQLKDVEKHAPKIFKKYKDCRTFILISTLMTWVKTKPIDPEHLTLPFTERDYRKRKPHPNYKVHCDFEKFVLDAGKKFPDNLKTIVIGSGITYGHEEDVLHFLFKQAWLSGTELPVFKPGNNIIPLIHIRALANIVHLIMEDFPNSVKYIIATEQGMITQRKIVKLISKKLGNGKIRNVSLEEAFTYPDVEQRSYDMLTVNLNIMPDYIINNMELTHGVELTFEKNIDAIIQEFRAGRNLTPIKIFIHGPPASGKTFLSRRLADYYGIHHLHVKEVVEEGIQDIKDRIREIKDREKKEKKRIENLGNDVDNSEEEDEVDQTDHDSSINKDDDDVYTLTQFLNEIEDNIASNESGRLDEHYVLQLWKRKLLSNPCQNHGYVIDGYPKTLEDTKALFQPDEDADLDDDGGDESKFEISRYCNVKIMPNFVAGLDASDEFLIQRVIKMPFNLVENSHYVEEEMCRRLIEYRTLNTESNSPLIFYDELEVYPMIYNVETNNDPEMNYIFDDIVNNIGSPRTYVPLPFKRDVVKERMNAAYMDEIKSKSQRMLQERREKMENWMFLKNQEKEMEEKALAIMALPLRYYLMKYIFPTLTRGLVEVARIRPSDPVDYLAEFLFNENPEGKMFHPNYDDVEEELLQAIKDHEISLADQDRDSDIIRQKSFSADESVMPDAVSNVTDVKAKYSGSSVPSIQTMKETTRSVVKEVFSSGSCKCSQISSQKSSTTSSSTTQAHALPCKCHPYSKSYHESSTSSTTDSKLSCHRDDFVPKCKCFLSL